MGQGVQEVARVWPTLRLKVPGGQGVPDVILVLGQYRPAGQGCGAATKERDSTRQRHTQAEPSRSLLSSREQASNPMCQTSCQPNRLGILRSTQQPDRCSILLTLQARWPARFCIWPRGHSRQNGDLGSAKKPGAQGLGLMEPVGHALPGGQSCGEGRGGQPPCTHREQRGAVRKGLKRASLERPGQCRLAARRDSWR